MRRGEALARAASAMLPQPSLGWFLLLLCTFPTQRAYPQGVTTAALEGRITATDAPLESAEVLVTNLETGERWRTTTSHSGRYAFDRLLPGRHRLEVRAIGFAPVTRPEVALALNTRTRIDIALGTMIQVLEPVLVSAEADPRIGPERIGPSDVLTDSTLRRLPARNRDLGATIPLSPFATRKDAKVSILGRDPRLTTLEVDGATAGDLLGGVAAPDILLAARPLALEALQQLEVQPAPYDVRYGSSSAGTVQAVTRSGTNRFEGSAWGYFTARQLQRSDGSDVGPDNATAAEAGLTLGGPIARDRATYFVQGGLQHYVIPTHVQVMGRATADGRDSTGFSQFSVRRLRQILLDHYAFDAGTGDRFPLDLPAGNLFAKVTWQPGVNRRFELSHAYDESTVDFLDDGCRQVHRIYCLTGSHFVIPVRTNATRIALTTALGSRLENELILARRRYTKRCTSADFPTVLVQADAGVLQAGANQYCGGDRDVQHLLELTDDVTLGLGAHRLTLGTHAERVRVSLGQASVVPLNTVWNFESLDALEAGRPSSYDALAANPARAGSADVVALASEQVAVYAEDQVTHGRWRATAGLRADVAFGLRSPTFNRRLLDSLGLDNSRMPGTHVLWAPRLGMSYDAKGDGRLFLRGGMGWFGGRPPFGWYAQTYQHTGLDEVHISCEGETVPAFTPDRAHQPTACLGGAVETVPGPVVLFDPSFRSPYAFKASVGTDARLPAGIVVTTDLIYTRGSAQLSITDRNLTPPLGASPGEQGRPLFGTIDPEAGLLPDRRTSAFERVVVLGSRGRDRSLAVSVEAEKRLGNGATITASYTYTDARDLLSATQDGLDGVVDSTTVSSPLEHSLRPTAWSAPHRVTMLVATDLPLHFTFALFYAGQSGSPYDYVVDGDANGDGYVNDPIYLPAKPRPGGDVTLAVIDRDGRWIPASASEYAKLAAFLHAQPCLRAQYGRLMLRNSCRNPWASATEARLAHTVALRSRTLSLTLDVFNPLNLVSANWGQVRSLNSAQLLRLVGYDAAHGRGVYVFQQPDRRQANPEESRWRMQLGATVTF